MVSGKWSYVYELLVLIINFQLQQWVARREKKYGFGKLVFTLVKWFIWKLKCFCFRILCMQPQQMKCHSKITANIVTSSISVVLLLVSVWSIFSCAALWCSMLVMNGLSFSTLPCARGFITFQSKAVLLKQISGKLYYLSCMITCQFSVSIVPCLLHNLCSCLTRILCFKTVVYKKKR